MFQSLCGLQAFSGPGDVRLDASERELIVGVAGASAEASI